MEWANIDLSLVERSILWSEAEADRVRVARAPHPNGLTSLRLFQPFDLSTRERWAFRKFSNLPQRARCGDES